MTKDFKYESIKSKSFSMINVMLKMCYSADLCSFYIMGVRPSLNNSMLSLTLNNLVSAVCLWLLKNILTLNFQIGAGGAKSLPWKFYFELLN